MQSLKFAGVIPARYASSRFPGKPLALIDAKPMIQHVYERVSQVLGDVVVATDDQRIFDVVSAFDGKACMTSPDHQSGTDRCREAAALTFPNADVIINIQGDEPFIDPSQIRLLMECFDDPATDIATLVRRFDPNDGFEALFDPNLVKVVRGDDGRAIYFSRSVIPYVRKVPWQEWLDKAEYFTHIGIYAYRHTTLKAVTGLKQSSLELAESLEQLRWLQAGYRIATRVSAARTIGIDTPADLEAAIRFYNECLGGHRSEQR